MSKKSPLVKEQVQFTEEFDPMEYLDRDHHTSR